MTREEFQEQLPVLAKNYRPALDVVDHVARINVLIVVGPSGVGKTTIIDRLPYKYVPSDTTRAPRPGETEGVDFYFRTDYDQIARDMRGGRFVQVAVDSGGDLKATRSSSYPEEGEVVMAVIADVVPIFRNLGFAKTSTVFITPPSYDEWMRRLQQHNFEQEQLNRRLEEAKRSFAFALSDEKTHFILSDEIDAATRQVTELMNGKIDDAREMRAQSIAEQISLRLNQTV
jgi:guanylate kinase